MVNSNGISLQEPEQMLSCVLFIFSCVSGLIFYYSIDEAAHIDPDLFYKTIAPILQMKNTSLMCLSSPEGDENYYSQLMNLVNPKTGKLFFKIYKAHMICERCKKLSPDRAILCTHVKQTAFWINKKKSEMLRLLYSTDPTTAMKEYGGVSISNFLPCFRKEEIQWAFEGELHNTLSVPPFIFIACDPNVSVVSPVRTNGTNLCI